MPNYNLKFTVGDAARIFKVEKDLIKTWAYKFSEYLHSKANPSKGESREFQLEDIRVMAYIFMYWEADPDIENIKFGLNSNSHYEHDMITNLLTEVTPLFIELPETIDETWQHGVVFGGFAEFSDTFQLANSYKLAGDRLMDIALKNEEGQELMCPAVYNYRHAIELYLKAITGKYKQSHDLLYLLARFKDLSTVQFNVAPPQWFEDIIVAFADFDPGGTTFRYGGKFSKDEVFIDFVHLKTQMGWLSKSFQNIKLHQEHAIDTKYDLK
jgi:hypothetical protein